MLMQIACLNFAVACSSKSLHAHNGILLYISDCSEPYGRAVLYYFPICPDVAFGGQVILVLLRQKRAPALHPGVLRLFLHGLWESQSAKLDPENTSPQINANCAVL